MSTDFIGLCPRCGINECTTYVTSAGTYFDPEETESICNECGAEDVIGMEDILPEKFWDKIPGLLETYQELKESEDYKERAKAQGMIEFLEAIV